MIKAVLFDLDGTLLDRASSLISFARQQHQRYKALQLISQEDYVSAFVALDDNGQVWKDKVYQQLIELYGLSGVTWEFLLQDYVEGFAIACIGLPNMILMLKALSAKNYRLGVITNGRSPFQEQNIQALGIQPFFSTVLVSEAVGLRKPDPAIFQKALHSMDVRASDAVFIGDSPESDIRGARRAGMKAIWKRHPYWRYCDYADATCDDLIELLNIIGQM